MVLLMLIILLSQAFGSLLCRPLRRTLLQGVLY